MGLTLSKSRDGVIGDLKYWIGTATGDSAYVTGGESLTAANLGMSSVVFVSAECSTNAGYVPVYDRTNATLKVYESGTASAALDECDNATDDLSSEVFDIFAVGIP